MTATLLSESAGPPSAPLSKGGSSWRPLLRLAVRDLRRRKGRTALVAVMIGLPISIMLVVATAVRTTDRTPEQAATHSLGQAAAAVYGPLDGSTDMSAGVAVSSRGGRLVAGDNRSRIGLLDGPLGDPIFVGKYEVLVGVLPTSEFDVAITPAVADRLRLAVGDIAIVQPGDVRVNVVGTFRDRGWLSSEAIAIAPGAFAQNFVQSRQVYFRQHDDVPASADEWGVSYRDSFSYENDNGSRIAILYTVGAVALIALGLLIVAAFASGARRQLRDLGLIAANGGDPRQVRRALALSGTATGAVGVLAGYTFFVVALFILAPRLEGFAGHATEGTKVSAIDVVLIGLMGVGASTYAAWLPARTVARTPVLAALGGRSPLPTVHARIPLTGLAMAVGGLVGLASSLAEGDQGAEWAWFGAALSGTAMLIGGALCAPWLVARLAGIASRTGGAMRLSSRRIARHRSRTGPLVAAIMAVAGGTIATAAVVESLAQQDRANQPDFGARRVQLSEQLNSIGWNSPSVGRATDRQLADAMSRLSEIFPDSQVVDVRYPTIPTAGLSSDASAYLAVARPETLRSLDAPLAAEILERDGYVVLNSAGDFPVELIMSESTSATGEFAATQRVSITPASSDEDPDLGMNGYYDDDLGRHVETTLLLSDAYIDREFGWSFNDLWAAPWLVAASDITDRQRASVSELNDRWEDDAFGRMIVDGESPMFQAYVSGGGDGSLNWARLGMLGAALLLTLVVVAIGLTLSSVEQRDDESTLAAIGASPSVRRHVRAAEAGTLTAMGSLLAMPLGGAAGWIIAANALDNNRHVRFPWIVTVAVCLVLPLASAAAAWLFTRTPRRVELGATV